MYLSISKCFVFCFKHIDQDQEYTKCDQITALNKNASDVIALPVFLSLYHFKMFLTSISSI